jgi:hypothetical protein
VGRERVMNGAGLRRCGGDCINLHQILAVFIAVVDKVSCHRYTTIRYH